MPAPRKIKKDRGQRIIANMGLFWSRNKVRWKGNRGIGSARLAGKRRSAKTRGVVDFWKQTGIYALYAEYHLVYVGQAGLSDQSCLGNRLKQHLTDDLAGRWDMFSWFGLQKVKATDNIVGKRAKLSVSSRGHLANVLEGIVIEVAEPPMNSQKGRFGRRVERYIQEDDSVESALTYHQKVLSILDAHDEKLSALKKRLATTIKQTSVRLELKLGKTKTSLAKAIEKVTE
jgi:hypothetical protein